MQTKVIGCIVLYCIVYLLAVCPKKKIYIHIIARIKQKINRNMRHIKKKLIKSLNDTAKKNTIEKELKRMQLNRGPFESASLVRYLKERC